MRALVRTNRKNYWGVYDNPYDEVTGRKKVWVPLTRYVVDNRRKSTDIDMKDMNFLSRHRGGIPTTDMVRAESIQMLDSQFFGQTINQTLTQLGIDGTVVWKTGEKKDKYGRPTLDRRTVDILNCYIDANANSIQEAYRFTERALLTEDQVKAMDWWNTDNVSGSTGMSLNDPSLDNVNTTAKYVEVFEMWGKIPEWLITGNSKDTDDVDGHIIISDVKKNPTVHLIERNTTKDKDGNIIKPYEEAWETKVPGRWYGVSAAEMVIPLQLWSNIVVNTRINRNYIAQLGIFKYRTGSGITSQSLKRLASNGAIKVNDMDDIQQFVIQEAGIGSYKDEETAVMWAQRITQTLGVASGEDLPSSMPATNALLSSQAQASAYSLIKEDFGLFLERWFDRHVLPIVGKRLKKNSDVIIRGETDNIRVLRERVAAYLVQQELDKMQPFDGISAEAAKAMQRVIKQLEDDGDIFFKNLEDIVVKNLDTKFYVTNESLDPGVIVKNLLTMMQIDQQNVGEYSKAALDLMGIEAPRPIGMNAQRDQDKMGAQMGGQMGTQNAQIVNSMGNQGDFLESNAPRFPAG